MTLSKSDAEHAAAYELRFNVGSIPFLSDPEYDADENAYVFDILYSRPDLTDAPFDSYDELQYYQTQVVGEMRVYDDEHIERTPTDEIEASIRAVKEKTDAGEIPYQ